MYWKIVYRCHNSLCERTTTSDQELYIHYLHYKEKWIIFIKKYIYLGS